MILKYIRRLMASRCFFYLLIFFPVLLAVSCKKLVTVNAPVTSVSQPTVYTSDATAISVLTGIYTQLSATTYATYGIPTLSMYAGLSADEFTLWSGVTNTSQIAYYTNNLSAANATGSDYWNSIYPYIFTCNAAIEGLQGANQLTPAVMQQLLGEAEFMRAFFYFYLVNLYGDVPMPLNTNYKTNEVLSRTSKSLVYRQIIMDLKNAENLLSSNYLDVTLLTTTPQKVRPTRWAAASLLARVYLYNQIYDSAEAQATQVIGNSAFGLCPVPDSVFKKNSMEAIWQLQPVSTSGSSNTYDALEFIIPSTGPNGSFPVALSSNLLAAFEKGDVRRARWVDSTIAGGKIYYFPYKYRVNSPTAPVTEYLMLFRLAEQYLIRAEARVQQNNLAGAVEDLNSIRNRAGLTSYTGSMGKTDLLAAIMHERQVELFTELGQRWLDLKRTGAIDSTMTLVAPQKRNSTWNSYQQLYPIPLADIQKDGNLSQNPGY